MFKFFVQAQNELWCTKWLDRAVLNVLASFEPIRSETIFNFLFNFKMSCDAPNGLRGAILYVCSKFWAQNELWCDQHFSFFDRAQNELWYQLNEPIERAILNVLASVQAQNELWCTKWLERAVLNVLASFEPIRSETIFHFFSSSEWVVMHQMAWESHSERFSKFWAHSERNNFSFLFKLKMSCDAPNGFKEPYWTF